MNKKNFISTVKLEQWYNITMNMDIICVAECEDCGKSLIMDVDLVTIFVMDGFTAATICVSCERPIVNEIDKKLAVEMIAKGVKMLSWETGEQISLDDE